MGQDRKVRIAADVFLLFAVMYFPWYATMLAGIAFASVFSYYFELIVAGLLVDLLYGIPASAGHIRYLYASWSLVVVLVSTLVRSRLMV